MSVSGPEILVVLMVSVASLFWLLTIRHCLENPRLHPSDRVYWLALMAITHVLGAVSYWVNRHRVEQVARAGGRA
jgi:hypothetical protein